MKKARLARDRSRASVWAPSLRGCPRGPSRRPPGSGPAPTSWPPCPRGSRATVPCMPSASSMVSRRADALPARRGLRTASGAFHEALNLAALPRGAPVDLRGRGQPARSSDAPVSPPARCQPRSRSPQQHGLEANAGDRHRRRRRAARPSPTPAPRAALPPSLLLVRLTPFSSVFSCLHSHEEPMETREYQAVVIGAGPGGYPCRHPPRPARREDRHASSASTGAASASTSAASPPRRSSTPARSMSELDQALRDFGIERRRHRAPASTWSKMQEWKGGIVKKAHGRRAPRCSRPTTAPTAIFGEASIPSAKGTRSRWPPTEGEHAHRQLPSIIVIATGLAPHRDPGLRLRGRAR